MSSNPTYQELARRRRGRPATESEFASSCDRRKFISSEGPQWQQTFGLHVVLSVEHLSAAHNAPRQRLHM
jgi:hypothetical protein